MTQQERQALEALYAELQAVRTQAALTTDLALHALRPAVARLLAEVGEVLR